MFNRWRRGLVVALVASAAIAAQLATVAAAQAATPRLSASPVITIAETSRFHAVTSDVFVVFRDGVSTEAAIHGTITGATAGEVATLYGQEFPYRKPAVRLRSITLESAKAVYSFTVVPVLATRYAVRLFAGSSANATMVATSSAVNLYVIGNGFLKGGTARCAAAVCHVTVQVFTVVPPTAMGTEMSKVIHPYFGLSLGFVNVPPPPKWMILNGGHAMATKARQTLRIEFEHTISYTFTIGQHSFSWAQFSCTRDSESADGIGLPGNHDCGAARVLRTIAYLG